MGPIRTGRQGNVNVPGRNAESVSRPCHRVDVAGTFPARHKAPRDLQEMRQLVRDRVRERGICRSRGSEANPRRITVVFHEPEQPGRGGEQVELEVVPIKFGKARKEGEHEIHERGCVAMGCESRCESHAVAGQPDAASNRVALGLRIRDLGIAYAKTGDLGLIEFSMVAERVAVGVYDAIPGSPPVPRVARWRYGSRDVRWGCASLAVQ